MMKQWIWIPFLAALFSLGCEKPNSFLEKANLQEKLNPPGERGELNQVRGRVTSAKTGEALADVRVELLSGQDRSVRAWAKTNLSGEYSLEKMPDGVYSLRVQNSGFVEFLSASPGRVQGGAHFRADASLNQLSHVEGRVVAKSTGAPIQGARALLFQQGTSELVGSATTDTQGFYSFGEIAPGDFETKFSASSYSSLSLAAPGTIGYNQRYNVLAELEDQISVVTGTVIDRGTRLPLANVAVQLLNFAGELIQTTQTNASGQYRMDSVISGTYKMSFALAEYVPLALNQPGVIVGGQTYTVAAELERKMSLITGTVIDRGTRLPLANVAVQLLNFAGELVQTTQTNASGQYRMDSVISGTYKMSFALRGYQPLSLSRPGVVIGGQTYVVDGEMVGAAARVFGQVVDALNGFPIRDAQADLLDAAGNLVFSALSDAAGNYAMEGVAPGNYKMVFNRSGYSEFQTSQPGVVVAPGSYQVNAALSEILRIGEYRIILTWGDSAPAISDVDSYLLIPGSPEQPVFYGNKNFRGSSLDLDDTSYSGPETITISEYYPGSYHYYVANYNEPSNGQGLADSDIRVSVYSGQGLVKQYSLRGGCGQAYHFFSITNGVITDVERYTTELWYAQKVPGRPVCN